MLSRIERAKLNQIITDSFNRLDNNKYLSRIERAKLNKEITDAFRQLEVAIAVQPEGTGEPEGVKIANYILARKYDNMAGNVEDLADAVWDLNQDQYGDLMGKVNSYLTNLAQKETA